MAAARPADLWSTPRVLLPPKPRSLWGGPGRAVLVLGIAVGIALPAVPVLAGWTNSPTSATITVGGVEYSSIACGAQQLILFWLAWPILHMSANLTTSNVGVTVLRQNGQSIPPNVTMAPPPGVDSPCNAPYLNGVDWFAILLDTSHYSVATFPVAGTNWDTGTAVSQPLRVGGWITICFGGDITGQTDRLSVYGVGGSTITLNGNTTVGPYHPP